MEHTVDGQPLVVQAQVLKLQRSAGRLLNRTHVGPGDQHDRGLRCIAQGLQGLGKPGLLHLEAGVRPEARSAAVVALQKTGPCFGQAQEAQRVAGGRGVKHHVVKARRIAAQQVGKLVKRGNFGGAGAR